MFQVARRGSAVYTAIAFHFALVTPIIDLTLDQEEYLDCGKREKIITEINTEMASEEISFITVCSVTRWRRKGGGRGDWEEVGTDARSHCSLLPQLEADGAAEVAKGKNQELE
ncbi:hypothetical protein V1478_013040 [Vespula squamosa]|uniref:Uncharacterized protein n=1 Tax=Vespula squamosa TaxID=30214 RepID=A0ABD2ABW3_VESSQ